MTKLIGRSQKSTFMLVLLQSAVYAQGQPKGLAAYESHLTYAFFGLLAAFVGLFAWEILDNRASSRSSLDIAKLAAAAAKKQSSAGAPSGSLSHLEPPPTSRPFAPPPPPPPPKVPEPVAAEPSPFSAPPQEPASNPFSAPPVAVADMGAGHIESTVAYAPNAMDAGSSGGWADLLQRVRAGEPEAASFEASPLPSTEEESFSSAAGTGMESPGAASPASSSEAWEALLKRTTGSEPSKGPASVAGDVGKISLNSNFQPPTESGSVESSPFGVGGGNSPFESSPVSEPPAMASPFSPSFEDTVAPVTPSAFSLPEQLPTAPEASGGFPFASSETMAEPSSPFGLGTSGGFSPPPVSGAGSSGGFESPSFRLPGAASAEDLGSSGFQLPTGGGANPFDFGGAAAGQSSSSSTMPLSDLFSKPGSGSPPAFQLPGSGGAAMDFSSGLDSDAANPGLGRTISLDFARGGGQKPPPPLPKTEG